MLVVTCPTTNLHQKPHYYCNFFRIITTKNFIFFVNFILKKILKNIYKFCYDKNFAKNDCICKIFWVKYFSQQIL